MTAAAFVAAGLFGLAMLSVPAEAQTLVPNGDFEQGVAGWSAFVPGDSKESGTSFAVENTKAHGGKSCARLHADTIARFCISPKPVTVQPGQYELTAWVRAEPGFMANRKQPGFVLRVSCFKPGESQPVDVTFSNWKGELGAGVDFPNKDTLPATWTQFKVLVTVPDESNRVKLDFFLWQASGALLLDDVSLIRRD